MGQFINGECLAEMKKLPDNCIDFIFTSPPYADQIKDYGATGIKIKPDKFDAWFLSRAQEMYRILKQTGSFVLNISDKLDGSFIAEYDSTESGKKAYINYGQLSVSSGMKVTSMNSRKTSIWLSLIMMLFMMKSSESVRQ